MVVKSAGKDGERDDGSTVISRRDTLGLPLACATLSDGSCVGCEDSTEVGVAVKIVDKGVEGEREEGGAGAIKVGSRLEALGLKLDCGTLSGAS